LEKNLIMAASHINKSFSGVKVLKDVQLNIRSGEVHAIMGENGAGKSTLIKILIGIEKEDSGEKTFFGEPLIIEHPAEIYEKGIGIVHQEFNLLPDLNVAQNIFIAREPKNRLGLVNERKMAEQARELLDRLNVKLDVNQKVSRLSIAEQQLVEIVKALSYDCKLLILDEPTAALAEEEAEQLFRILRDLRDQGVAIIFVSHRMSDIKKIVDRVTVLRDGCFIAEHLLSETTEEQLVSEIVGRKLEAYYPPKPKYERGEPTLEVRNLSVNGILDNISFTAYKGEILAIAGLMGSGRTELAHAIFGKIKLNSGEVFINGKKVKNLNPNKSISNKLGYSTEDRKKDGLMLNLGIKSNILISNYKEFSNLFGLVKDSAANKTVDKYIGKLNIKTTGRNQLTSSLSGGNQQKVVLSRWLCADIDILIMDEPTRGIDIGAKVEIYNLMHELVLNGVTVIFISSEMPEVLGMSDRVLIMNHGKIVADLDVKDVTQEVIFNYSSH
jgi:ribose transport system ATP-binding protein